MTELAAPPTVRIRNIWVTSDTHFFHDNIIRYCVRPYRDAYHMNAELVARWNSVVKRGDKVYHLGDVLMGGKKAIEEFPVLWSKLHGQKRLVIGNHDDIKFLAKGAFFDKVMLWRWFEGLLLTHVPTHPRTLAEGRSGRPQVLNVHGHTHTDGSPEGPYKSVCVELTDYTPVHIDTLLALKVANGD